MSTSLPPGCDCPIAATSSADTGANVHPRLVLATTILASSLAFIDGSVVNVGLPAIGHSLNADAAGLSWVINGYLLPLSALLLLGGAAGDRFGRKKLLLTGICLFALASILCMAAPSLGWLIAGRVLQGTGAALLMPNSLAILGANFSGEERGRAIGTWAAIGAGAGAVGPLLGGWLIDIVGWRTIFLINLPIAAMAFYLGARYLHDKENAANPANPAKPKLDLAGALLASSGLACLTWGLTVASAQSRLDGAAMAAILAGIVILLIFLRVEKRAGENAMLPVSLFVSHAFTGLNLLTFLLYGALGALMVLVPFVLIKVDGYSATAAGAALLPLPIVIALASSSAGRLAGRIGPRLPLMLGPLIVAAGFLLATRIGSGSSYWTTTLPAMLVIALGMAGAVAPLTTAVLASVDAGHTGVASGFNSAVARSGGLIATALLGMLLASQGAALVTAFHVAAFIAALAALASSACAFLWIRPEHSS